ncbi:hypothetical protein ACJMK2_012006 [Sinanodonta woodiana]|uniref:Uncharacterized protein n=1 Tax=Sinanodonta woodiana TaxID=1069815 RepID=A0ABD3V8Z9_SINWO
MTEKEHDKILGCQKTQHETTQAYTKRKHTEYTTIHNDATRGLTKLGLRRQIIRRVLCNVRLGNKRENDNRQGSRRNRMICKPKENKDLLCARCMQGVAWDTDNRFTTQRETVQD